MLFISRSMDLWQICISSLCLIEKTVVSIYFDLQLPPLAPNSSYISQIINELCSSSSYSFHFHHLYFSGIMNFFSEYNQFNWLFYLGYYLEISSCLLNVQELFIFILFQHHISSSPNSCFPILTYQT